jgi:carotenoid 1,2-hydratase
MAITGETGADGGATAMSVLTAATQQMPHWDALDCEVPHDGYRWWYVDALSDDGRTGLTLICMLGSVFSPYYARQRRSGPVDPLEHCALNVALYGRPVKRWALTERGRGDLERSAEHLRIGPSCMARVGDTLHFEINERSAVLGRPLVGDVTVRPLMQTPGYVLLNPRGQHCWWPISPRCEVEVAFRQPALTWHGTGYLDSNFGAAPLEHGFRCWDWSRAALPSGRTAILYNVEHVGGAPHSLALSIAPDGTMERRPPPARTRASRGFWGVPRETRADNGTAPRLLETLEDTPFYTRSVLGTTLFGEDVHAMHESLDLQRFQAPWVQSLIPVRNPRRAGAKP